MRLTILVATAALVFPGCSDSDRSSDGPGPDGPPTTTASQEARPESPKSRNGELAQDGHPSASASEHPQSDNPTWSPDLGGGLKGDWELLRPDGFIELRLGMTPQEALKAGRIQLSETARGCTGFYLAMYGDAGGLGPHGYFSKDGLAVIHAQGGMHTPEGVALGTPAEEVLRTYPAARRSDGLLTVAASNQAEYFFIMGDDAVRYFGLSLSDDPCLSVAFD